MEECKISSGEILQDIAYTKAEIDQMTREMEGYRMIGDKMSHFRADARQSGIHEREIFIQKLEAILKERKEKI